MFFDSRETWARICSLLRSPSTEGNHRALVAKAIACEHPDRILSIRADDLRALIAGGAA